MSFAPIITPARYTPRLDRRVPAAFLWRSRDDLLSALTGEVATFSRTESRTTHAANGMIIDTARDYPRCEMWDCDGDGVPETPVLALDSGSAPHINRVRYMQDVSQGAHWTAVNSPAVLATTIPLGDFTLQLLEDNSGSLVEHWTQALTTWGATAARYVSFYMAQGTVSSAGGSRILITESAATRLEATITWNAEAPVVAGVTGTYLGAHCIGIIPDSNGIMRRVYRLVFVTTASWNAANATTLQIEPAKTAAEQGNVFWGLFQIQDSPGPSAPILTTTSTASRAVEAMSFPYFTLPQATALTFAILYVENGGINLGSLLGWIGHTGLSGAYLQLTAGAGASISILHHNGTSQVVGVVSASPAFGAKVLVRGVLRADGSVIVGFSVNGGAETLGTASAALTRATAWGDNKLVLAGTAFVCNRLMAVGVFHGEQSAAYCAALMA